MSVEIKGKKCRNIAQQVAWNDYRIGKIIKSGEIDYVEKAEVKESGNLLELTQYNATSKASSTVQFRGGGSGPSTYIKEISGGTTSIPKYYAFDQNNTQVAEWLPVEDNPGQDPTNPDLTSIKIGNGKFNIPLVKGNPSEAGTLTLNKLKINDKIYNVPDGSGGEPAAYLKSADVSTTNTLKLKNKDDSDTTFTVDLSSKLDASKSTIQTTAPTAAITDGGIHIVVLSTDPATKYDGYIYLIG